MPQANGQDAMRDSAQTARWMQPRNLLRLSVVVALLTIVLKTLAWWLTGSVGLLSDALESFVNLAGAMFALAMVTIAARKPDDDHPYGHHKAEYFSSGFEGILVIGASVSILLSAIPRVWNPVPLEQIGWGLALSLLSTAFNAGLAWVMFRSARIHRSMALQGDARHLLTDVWTSVGVVAGLVAASLTGWIWLDAVVAIGVALNIFLQGCQMVWQSSQGLMDQAMPLEQRDRIDAVLAQFTAQDPQVLFDNVTTRTAGERSFVELHMHVPGGWSVAQAAQRRSQVESALLATIAGVYARIELLPQGMATAVELEAERHASQG